MSGFRTVMCGGGIAAVEGLLRLRRLVGEEMEITLLAPNEELVYRPLAVEEPFAMAGARRYPLDRIVRDARAEWLQDALEWVDVPGQVVHTEGGHPVEWDALLIAVGARNVPPFRHAQVFSDTAAALNGLIQDVEGGFSRSVAFIMPEGPVWPFPLYELALMTRERADSMGMDELELMLVTPEAVPLERVGGAASDAVDRLLESARITLYTSAVAQVPASQHVLLQPQGIELRPERVVTLPRIEGPAIRGLHAGAGDGFIPIDAGCRVPGTGGRVFAAGDATAFPIKHGGLGSQQADTAAAGIARLAGADVELTSFKPVIRGTLLTGKQPLHVSAHVVGARGFMAEVHDEPPWPADEKVVAEELGPYLAGLDARRG